MALAQLLNSQWLLGLIEFVCRCCFKAASSPPMFVASAFTHSCAVQAAFPVAGVAGPQNRLRELCLSCARGVVLALVSLVSTCVLSVRATSEAEIRLKLLGWQQIMIPGQLASRALVSSQEGHQLWFLEHVVCLARYPFPRPHRTVKQVLDWSRINAVGFPCKNHILFYRIDRHMS